MRPARAPRDHALPLRLPGAEAERAQGCFLNEAAFISGGLLTTDEGALVPDSVSRCTPAILHRRREKGAREDVG